MALRHSLYVQRAVPIHRWSFSFSSAVGYRRMRLAFPGGGFSGVDGFASFFFLDRFGGGAATGCFLTPPSVIRRTSSVMLCDKHGDDGDEVIGELLFWVGVVVLSFATLLVAKNHEFCISLSEDPLEEFHAESCESVVVGNHDLSDASLVDLFQ
eukprot:Mycagemm_TRINITY_DN10268_c0_g1::TRINITY_DN10268_c0_g1_i1::g.3945::m.3945 type:complete len:154 gc:universal TRINITY_DN10268_c0_g1_i1:1500-1961(+)